VAQQHAERGRRWARAPEPVPRSCADPRSPRRAVIRRRSRDAHGRPERWRAVEVEQIEQVVGAAVALGEVLALTERDRNADNLLDLFDFDGSPSLGATVSVAGPPAIDCTPQ